MESEGGRNDLVIDLARPEAYPPPRPLEVRVSTTHASWVFLTEGEAWKVKRPVDYGFLDFSDAEKRRRSCEEETRLGERLAPGIYRGVVPVFLGPGGHTFTGPGEIVDHAVRMQRLADDESALAFARAGRLSPAHLAALAAALAEFYARAAPTPELGDPAIFAANIAENHEQTAPYVGRFVDAQTVNALHRWQQGMLAAGKARLYERLAQGRIREGHGDLRLEHVYFPVARGGGPVVIDPIEFNRSFRCVDVALDAAFLAMELDALALPELAAYFMARFARETGDYAFYPLLSLYLSYRAWVRAKVACFVAADPTTPGDKAQRKAAEARRLFALAAGYARPSSTVPHVIAVGGMIGAGKSTLAEVLGRELQLPVVSSDVTRKQRAGVRPDERGDASLYTDESTRATYEAMVHHAEPVLASGRGVVLDATFRTAATRALARGLARRFDRPFLFVELTCDEETLRGRLRARAEGPRESDADEALLARISWPEPADELGASERLPLDARAAPGMLAAEVRARLGITPPSG